MAEHESKRQDGLVDSQSDTALDRVDLSKYQTDELVDNVSNLLSIPQSLRTVLFTILFSVGSLVIADWILFSFGENSIMGWLVSTVYLLVVGTLLGVFLGVIRVASRLIRSLEQVLVITLETSRSVANDFEEVRQGDKALPTSIEVVEAVYEGVIEQVVQKVLEKSFGLVGMPLIWIYRRTLGGGVRFLIKRMKDNDEIVPLNSDATEQDAISQSDFEQAFRSKSSLTNGLERATGYTQFATQMVRRFLLLPLQVVFLLVAVVFLLPVVLFWQFF